MSVSRLAPLPMRAPGLVDENFLAVDLVNPVRDHEDDEERDRTDCQEEIDRIRNDRGEESVHGLREVSHVFLPDRTSFPHSGKTFLREALPR